MTKLSNTQRRNLVNKSFGVVQKCIGLGIPVNFGLFQFNTFNHQYLIKRKVKGPRKSFIAKYSKSLLASLSLLPKGAMGKFTVGKLNVKKEELDKMVDVLKTR